LSGWLLLSLLWLAYALNYADRQAVFSIFPALQRELHFSETQLGLVGSIFTWSYSLTMPFTGALADRLGRTKMVVSSIIVWSCATLGTALSSGLDQFLSMRALMGVTEALYVPASYGLLGATFPERLRSRVLAIHATAQFAGIAAGSAYGGWIADRYGWRTGFEWAASAGTAYGILLMIVLPHLRLAKTKERDFVPLSGFLLRGRGLMFLMIAFSTFCLLLWILYAWLPFFVYDHFHLSMARSGFVTSFLQVGAALGVFIGGFVGDYFARRRIATRGAVAGFGLLSCAPFGWLMFSASSLSTLRFVMIGFGLLSGLFIANVFAAMLDHVHQQHYSFAAAIVNMTGGVAGGLGILLVGAYRAEVGMESIVAGASLLVAFSALPLLTASLRRPAAVNR
jgi:MFS family permease